MSAIGKKKICHIRHFALSLPIIFKKLSAVYYAGFYSKKLIIKKLSKNINCSRSFTALRFRKKQNLALCLLRPVCGCGFHELRNANPPHK